MMRAPRPMIAGPRITDRSTTAPASIDDLALDAALGVDRAVDAALEASRGSAGWLRACPRACRCPSTSPSTMCGCTRQAAVDQVLDRVGDLELVAEARLDAVDRLEDLAARTCRRRPAPGRRSAPSASRRAARPCRRRSSATPNICGSGTARQQDLRRRLLAARTPATNCVMPLLSRLSPRYITNGSSPMNVSADLDGVRQAARRVLLDVGDA